MATVAAVTGAARPYMFAVGMAGAIFATAVAGFAFNAAMGRVDIPRVPFWVHLHAIANMSWVALLFAQSLLAGRGRIALHRRLGWLGAALLAAVVTLGFATTVLALMVDRVPPFFSPPFFLMLDALNMLAFGGLALSAILMRRTTDWHYRLQLSAGIVLIAPAWGRILPMPLIGDWAGWACLVPQLGYFAAMALHDVRGMGRVHRATWTGVAVLALSVVLMRPLAESATVRALAAMFAG